MRKPRVHSWFSPDDVCSGGMTPVFPPQRVECLLEDQGTRSAMEQYISGVGKHANSEGLAQAVTDIWNSLGEDSESPTLADRDLAPRTAREWFRRMEYRWIDLKKGVYKDGHERPDVVAYRHDTLLP